MALELLSKRRFRSEDGVAVPGLLPSGGGPAAQFDPTIGKLALASARALLAHVNPETGLPLENDPALAWVTLAGEVSLFNLIDNPDSLPPPYAKALRQLAEKTPGGTGRRSGNRSSRRISNRWPTPCARTACACRSPASRTGGASPSSAPPRPAPGLDLIDDRLFWPPFLWSSPEMHSLLWSPAGSRAGGFRRSQTPTRSALCPRPVVQPDDRGLVLSARGGRPAPGRVHRDVRRLGRRGPPRDFRLPLTLGRGAGAAPSAAKTSFQIAEVDQRQPAHLRALAARGFAFPPRPSMIGPTTTARGDESSPRAAGKGRRRSTSGWDPSRGQLVIDTPYTQGVAGWIGSRDRIASLISISRPRTRSRFSSPPRSATSRSPPPNGCWSPRSPGSSPPASAGSSAWKREVADPGRPPFLQEPVTAQVVWRRKGTVRAFVLDNDGERIDPVRLEPLAGGEGVSLRIDGNTAAFHWELTIE